MYGLLVENKKDEAKAERIIQKFSKNVEVRRGNSIMFIYSVKPVARKVCMSCPRVSPKHNEEFWRIITKKFPDYKTKEKDLLICPMTKQPCRVERVIEEALVGFRALLYARVKTKLVISP